MHHDVGRPAAAGAPASDPRARRRADRDPPPGPASPWSGCSSRRTRRGRSRGPGARRRAARGGPGRASPVREATPNEVKVARDRLRQRRQGAGRADGRRDPPARRGAPPGRHGRRAGDRDLRRANSERPGTANGAAGAAAGAAVLDRAAIAPIARGETPYERAVREALASETRARRRQARHQGGRRLGTRAAVIASVEGRVGAVAADSLVIEVGGIGYRVFAAPAVIASATPGGTPQAPHVPPRPRGPAGAVRVPDVRGAGVLQPAAHRDRRRAEGRARDRRLAPDAPTSSSRSSSRTRRCSSRSRGSARSSPSGSSSSSRRRSRRRASPRGPSAAVATASEGEVVGGAPGARLLARRGARGVPARARGPGGRAGPRGARQGRAPDARSGTDALQVARLVARRRRAIEQLERAAGHASCPTGSTIRRGGTRRRPARSWSQARARRRAPVRHRRRAWDWRVVGGSSTVRGGGSRRRRRSSGAWSSGVPEVLERLRGRSQGPTRERIAAVRAEPGRPSRRPACWSVALDLRDGLGREAIALGGRGQRDRAIVRDGEVRRRLPGRCGRRPTVLPRRRSRVAESIAAWTAGSSATPVEHPYELRVAARLASDDGRRPRASSRRTCRRRASSPSKASLRPRTLDEYIGQREVKANLDVLLRRRRAGERRRTTSCCTARPASARRPSRRSSPASSASTSATRAGRRSSGRATSPRSSPRSTSATSCSSTRSTASTAPSRRSSIRRWRTSRST